MKPVNQSELFDTLAEVLGLVVCEGPAAECCPSAVAEPVGLRILLAEDSLYNQKLAVGLLEKKGHLVTVANDGAEAVSLAQGNAFDIVLMDVQMPQMDGLEATRVIRERESRGGRRVPIIAMTAQAMKGDRERCLEAGMDDYLTKPVRPQQLYSTIAHVVDNAAPCCNAAANPTPRNGAAAAPAEMNGTGVAWSRGLAAVGGDAALLSEIASAFLVESQKLLRDIDDALIGADATLLHRAAHTIKAGLRTFGADVAYELASRIEIHARKGEIALAAAPCADLRNALEEILRELAGCVEALHAARTT
jgi:CheY-like chemotaxis protein